MPLPFFVIPVVAIIALVIGIGLLSFFVPGLQEIAWGIGAVLLGLAIPTGLLKLYSYKSENFEFNLELKSLSILIGIGLVFIGLFGGTASSFIAGITGSVINFSLSMTGSVNIPIISEVSEALAVQGVKPMSALNVVIILLVTYGIFFYADKKKLLGGK